MTVQLRYIRKLGPIHDDQFDIFLHSWVFLYNHQRNGTSWFQTVDDILSTFV